ncbi:MAG: hypothetical protein EOM59_06300 [Clostridia bacterium]|nr:hypothetical protein [Clostridia bacterium]
MNHQNASVVSDNMHFVNFASTRRYSPKQAELSDDPKAQRQQYKQQMAGLLMGIPPSQGSPATAPIASSSFQGGLWLSGSIIIPAAILAKQSTMDCFSVRHYRSSS